MNADFLIAPSHTCPVCFYHSASHCHLCWLLPFILCFFTSLCPAHISLTFTFLLSFPLFSRFSIDPQSDPEALFRITPDSGLITTALELDREREHWHNITIIATQRGQRSLFVRHFTANTRALDYMELKPSSEASFLLPLTPAATDEREGRGGLREFKRCIVQSLKSTASCECCTSLSSLALDSSSHERNAVWRHKRFDTACLRIDLYCASYLMLQ